MLDTPTKIRCCNVDLESLEFDGETVLCRVCGDKASGFHYGVHACEGCKGFFRRSIQQKIQYRPCLKNQECTISRVNRNRCQYCRLKKCIAVGMSRDAVRFGRVPKKEKAKILEQMQKVNLNSQTNYLTAILQNDNHVISQTIKAHAQTCEFTREKFERFQKRAWQKPEFVACSSNRACPLNPNVLSEKKWSELSDSFTPAVQSVVDFAKSIPGFTVLTQEDQMTLLKAGTFEVLLLRLACLFDCQTNTMMFVDGKLYKRNNSQEDSTGGFLQESMFEFAERLADLKLTDDEMGLFSAIVVIATNRPGLRNPEHVECIQSKLTHGLQNLLLQNHPDDPALFGKLLMKIPDLRTLNTLHSEKLFGMSQSLKKSPPEVPETPGPPAPVEPICPMSARRTSAPEASYPSYPNIIPNLKHQVSALPNYQSQLDMVRKIKAEMSTQPSSSHSDSNIVRSNTWSYSPQQKDYSMLKKRHSQVHADEFLQASMVSHLNDKILSDKFQTVRGMLNDRPDLMYAPYYPYMYSKEMMYSYYPYGFAPPVTKQELKFDLELASRLHKEKEYRDRSPCDSPRLRLNSTGGNSSKTESSSPSSSPKCWNEQRETKSPLEHGTHSPRSLAQSPYSMYPPHMQKGSQEKTHDRETLFRSSELRHVIERLSRRVMREDFRKTVHNSQNIMLPGVYKWAPSHSICASKVQVNDK